MRERERESDRYIKTREREKECVRERVVVSAVCPAVLRVEQTAKETVAYRGTSLIRNQPPLQNFRRAPGLGLL